MYYTMRYYAMNSSNMNLLHVNMIRRTVRVNTFVVYLSRECSTIASTFVHTLRSLPSTSASNIAIAKIACITHKNSLQSLRSSKDSISCGGTSNERLSIGSLTTSFQVCKVVKNECRTGIGIVSQEYIRAMHLGGKIGSTVMTLNTNSQNDRSTISASLMI